MPRAKQTGSDARELCLAQKTTLIGRTVKFHEPLGVMMDYAIARTEKGEPYFYQQGDHIAEDAGDTHTRKQACQVVFAAPMPEDFANAFGIEISTTGLVIAVKQADEMLAKFRGGELTGFSIDGSGGVDEELENA